MEGKVERFESQPFSTKQNETTQGWSHFVWRRGRDSNPGTRFRVNSLAVSRFRPLSHLSGLPYGTIKEVGEQGKRLYLLELEVFADSIGSGLLTGFEFRHYLEKKVSGFFGASIFIEKADREQGGFSWLDVDNNMSCLG